MTATGIFKTSLALSLVMLMASVHAETYRWVDENGVVNYSQRKPRGVEAEVIGSTAPAPATAAAAAPQPGVSDTPAADNLTAEQQEMKAELEAAELERQEQIAKIRQDNCERARRVLANLSSEGRIRIQDEQGNQRAMPEEERQQRITEAQKGIVSNCSSS